jgi:YfiH family protein
MSKVHFTSAPDNLALHTGDDRVRVVMNRSTLKDQLELESLQFMEQSHSDVLRIVDSYTQIDIAADALVTARPNIGLAVLVADCIPLLLSSATCVAAVHVGRVGMTNGIIDKTVNAMEGLGAKEISAWIGPSICGACYEVSPSMYDEVTTFFPAAATSDQAHTLDLPRGTIEILRLRGIDTQALGICTLEDSHYFSYRRDKTIGRQAGVISLS